MATQHKPMPTLINTLPATVTEEIVEFTKAKIEEVENAMPYLLHIADDDLPSLAKLDAKKEGFIRDTLIEMKNMKGKVPTVANADTIRENLGSYDALYDLEDAASEFYQKVRRNRMDRGSKALREALNFYNSLDMAIKAKIPGAAECKKRLAVYFASGNNSDKKPDTPPASSN
jgi:hypothetical protein